MVDLGLVWFFFKVYLGIFRVRFFWRSFKVLRFVEVSVNSPKDCKLRRIYLNNASKGDLGTVLAKHKNAMRRR